MIAQSRFVKLVEKAEPAFVAAPVVACARNSMNVLVYGEQSYHTKHWNLLSADVGVIIGEYSQQIKSLEMALVGRHPFQGIPVCAPSHGE